MIDIPNFKDFLPEFANNLLYTLKIEQTKEYINISFQFNSFSIHLMIFFSYQDQTPRASSSNSFSCAMQIPEEQINNCQRLLSDTLYLAAQHPFCIYRERRKTDSCCLQLGLVVKGKGKETRFYFLKIRLQFQCNRCMLHALSMHILLSSLLSLSAISLIKLCPFFKVCPRDYACWRARSLSRPRLRLRPRLVSPGYRRRSSRYKQ